MHKFSIDYLTGQDAQESKVEASFSDDSSSSAHDIIPSPIFSEDGGAYANGHSSLDRSPVSLGVGSRSDAKPPHSYIALISMAILSTDDRKMLLSDIYGFIMDRFPYYNNKDKAWRNSIRHNLSLNECFVKSGRADNGKGNYWSIHPACVEDFAMGDFRRRQARRRARKSTLTRNAGVSSLPFNYRYSLGYVPMTLSTVATSAYRPCYTSPSAMYYNQGVYPTAEAAMTVAQGLYSPYPGYAATQSSPPAATSIPPAWSCDLNGPKDFVHASPFTE